MSIRDRDQWRPGWLERLVGVVAILTAAAYDEGSIKSRLDAAAHVRQVLFACACAERIFPALRVVHSPDGPG